MCLPAYTGAESYSSFLIFAQRHTRHMGKERGTAMGRRVIGGLVGWLIGVLPLVGVNLVNYFGFYPGDPVVVGMLALFGGLIVGAVISGLIGGRARDNGMSGPLGRAFPAALRRSSM